MTTNNPELTAKASIKIGAAFVVPEGVSIPEHRHHWFVDSQSPLGMILNCLFCPCSLIVASEPGTSDAAILAHLMVGKGELPHAEHQNGGDTQSKSYSSLLLVSSEPDGGPDLRGASGVDHTDPIPGAGVSDAPKGKRSKRGKK